MTKLLLHHETNVTVNATPDAAFAYLDDFNNLAAHLAKPSAMTVGSKMSIATDVLEGRDVGSRIHMRGRMLGVRLSLEEVVTERQPPVRKAWKTVDTNLLVIRQYRLGFELSPAGERAQLRVFIDYELPDRGVGRWLGRVLGKTYARWCTQRMATDAATHFAAALH